VANLRFKNLLRRNEKSNNQPIGKNVFGEADRKLDGKERIEPSKYTASDLVEKKNGNPHHRLLLHLLWRMLDVGNSSVAKIEDAFSLSNLADKFMAMMGVSPGDDGRNFERMRVVVNDPVSHFLHSYNKDILEYAAEAKMRVIQKQNDNILKYVFCFCFSEPFICLKSFAEIM
jgi:hypothetical protein